MKAEVINKLVGLPVVLVAVFMAGMTIIHLLSVEFGNQIEISLLMFILGVAIIAIGGHTFRKKKTTINPTNPELTTYLVTSGVYRYSRNPMYVGFLVWLFAWAAFLGNIVTFCLFPFYILLVNKLYILPEEEALTGLFGNEFDAYRRRVGRWV